MIKYIFFSTLLLLLYGCDSTQPPKTSGAGLALEYWGFYRTYPNGTLPVSNLSDALNYWKSGIQSRVVTPWKALGPKNIGGRTIALGFHPLDSNIIYAGSASGGLWVTFTGGKGAEAWERIETGYPVLGVSAIAVHPTNPEIMYIGTGEVYNDADASIGYTNRLTRGTYGIGILRTSDGGKRWEKSLDWSRGDLTGVQDLVFNPLNPQTLFAATTLGLYRSRDDGQSWQKILDIDMAVDVAIHPLDSNIVLVTNGSFFHSNAGIYRSTDGGDQFTYLEQSAPKGYSGKALLEINPSNPDHIYCTAANYSETADTTVFGLYESFDRGRSWLLINRDNLARWQGWYSHDVAVHPERPQEIIRCGVDLYRSSDGGVQNAKITSWQNWFFGKVPVGGPEGPPNYVHADIHKLEFHPHRKGVLYAATDGGIFVSYLGGVRWEGINGGYQTQQFYANFSNSQTDPNFAIGGMQDNATAIYEGDDAWVRVLGGDGMSTAIHPDIDEIVFGSYQYLNTFVSTDRGEFFDPVPVLSASGENSSFCAPFEISPIQPTTIYAGAQRLHRSDNLGDTWAPTTNSYVDGPNTIQSIGCSPIESEFLLLSLAPDPINPTRRPGVWRTLNGGANFVKLNGLPDRVAMDFGFDPQDAKIVYVVFSGFGSKHVFRSKNRGNTWEAIDQDLPDLPTNSILVDPENSEHLYIANDLGVFRSLNQGNSWEWLSSNMPDALLAMHLSIAANRKLRVATHGNGVWETDLLDPVSISMSHQPSRESIEVYPNPANGFLRFQSNSKNLKISNWEIIDTQGKSILKGGPLTEGTSLDIRDLSPGIYFLKIHAPFQTNMKLNSITKSFRKI